MILIVILNAYKEIPCQFYMREQYGGLTKSARVQRLKVQYNKFLSPSIFCMFSIFKFSFFGTYKRIIYALDESHH